MATRLLSFLTEIEHALRKERAVDSADWSCQRIVNFKDRLARMTLSLPAAAEMPPLGGAILLQSFLLGDGSLCLKVMLSWDGSPATSSIAVHARPRLDWAAEARRIASAWLAGPPATATVESVPMQPAVGLDQRGSQNAASG